jgi:hypothetical protein
MEKISWMDCVKNEETLQSEGVKGHSKYIKKKEG